MTYVHCAKSILLFTSFVITAVTLKHVNSYLINIHGLSRLTLLTLQAEDIVYVITQTPLSLSRKPKEKKVKFDFAKMNFLLMTLSLSSISISFK